MDKKELESLVVTNDFLGKNKQVAVRLPIKLLEKLKKHDINIQESVRNFLERYAETLK